MCCLRPPLTCSCVHFVAVRTRFPGASADTPFVNGGLLPYWVEHAEKAEDVMFATYALNSSRAHTATADSRIFSETLEDGKTPNADLVFQSGISDIPIHFNATQAVALGHSYWRAYQQAVKLSKAVPNDETNACLRDAAREAALSKKAAKGVPAAARGV